MLPISESLFNTIIFCMRDQIISAMKLRLLDCKIQNYNEKNRIHSYNLE